MARTTTQKARAQRVNISLSPEILEGIDRNVECLKIWLIGRGATEKDVNLYVTRSALISEMAKALATETGLLAIKTGFSAALGINVNQTDLFEG